MSYRLSAHRTQPSHSDDWLITYADMITLLLCFFVLFLIISIKKDTAHKTLAKPIMEKTAEIREPELKQKVKDAPKLPDVFANIGSFRKLEEADFEALKTPPKPEEHIAVAPTLALPEPPPPPPQKSLDKQMDGDRITILELNSATFFDSGSATLRSPGKTLLLKVSNDLKSEKYSDYLITVEGHTDDTPISTPQFPSNWELSTARASSVVHFFLDRGIPAAKLRAAGYASTFPKRPNRDAAGKPIPANQAQNRRVVIKLEKIEKSL